MTDLRETAQQMLKAWDDDENGTTDHPLSDTIEALRAALAQQEQEPVAWIQSNHLQQAQREPFLCRVEPTQRLTDFVPLYTQPPRREWRSLTNEELNRIESQARSHDGLNLSFLFLEIQQALKEKNNG